MTEIKKRVVLTVVCTGTDEIGGINAIPLNDVIAFMFERHFPPDDVKEFIERTAAAVAEIDERRARRMAEKKANDEAWEAKRKEAREKKSTGGKKDEPQ